LKPQRIKKNGQLLSNNGLPAVLETKLQKMRELNCDLFSIKEGCKTDTVHAKNILFALLKEIEYIGDNITDNILNLISTLDEEITPSKWLEIENRMTTIYEELFRHYESPESKTKETINDIRSSEKSIIKTETSKPIFIIVILESGLPVYAYNFKKEEIGNSKYLIAGLINAIDNFASEVFSQKGKFLLMEHSEYIILFEKRMDYTIALFTEPSGYEMKGKLNAVADEIDKIVDKFPPNNYIEGEVGNYVTKLLDEKVENIF